MNLEELQELLSNLFDDEEPSQESLIIVSRLKKLTITKTDSDTCYQMSDFDIVIELK